MTQHNTTFAHTTHLLYFFDHVLLAGRYLQLDAIPSVDSSFCHQRPKAHQRLSWKQHFLSIEGRRMRDQRYPKVSLCLYGKSPFVYMLNSRNDQALLNVTGVDFTEFDLLLNRFQPLFESFTVNESTGTVVKTGTGDVRGQLMQRERLVLF
jgi:hypothetical protein